MYRQTGNWYLIISALCIVILPWCSLSAQQRLDFGFVLGPELNHITSEARETNGDRALTTGHSGVSVGFVTGAYLEYEIFGGLSLRGGLNYTRKRFNYAVTELRPESGEVREGNNRVVYTAIEVPFALLYRFHYLPNNDRFIVGVGAVVDRWLGDPQIETPFVAGSADRDYIQESYRSVNFFVGYDHYISDRFVVGIEPYVSYSPTEFRFDTETLSSNQLQAGISLRLRFDN